MFLLGAAGACAAAALGACDSRTELAVSPYDGEYRTIALAAALEGQAAGFYRSVLVALRAGRLGEAGPAFTELAESCARQHAAHARTWNAILRSGNKPPLSGVPLADQLSVTTAIRSATTAPRAAALACRLEIQATQTYVAAAGSLASPAAVAAAARIAPVEAMHAAVLRFILGENPAPASFAGTAAAAKASLLTA